MSVLICNKLTYPIRSYREHYHSNCEIILQISACASVTVGGNVYQMNKGDVLVIPPYVNHSGISEVDFLDAYVQATSLDFSKVLKVHDYDGIIVDLFNIMHKITTEKEYNYLHIADSLLEAICQCIEKHSQKDYKYAFVNDLKNVIYKNISNPDFDINYEIKKMGYNSDYFRRCFREELGVTPHEYLTSLRIALAKKMLKYETSLTIENIALNCGFLDNFYFSRLFKKHCGVSPSEYRKY